MPRIVALALLGLLGCGQRTSPRPLDAAAPRPDVTHHTDASQDATRRRERFFVNGNPAGWIRFVNLSTIPTAHFIADNAPNYQTSHVVAPVAGNTDSGYLPAVAVPHRIRVRTQADGPDLLPPFVADVYETSGCTVVLVGDVRKIPRPDGRGPTPFDHLRFVRVVDAPEPTDAGISAVRFFHAANTPNIFIAEDGGTPEMLMFATPTGARMLSVGEHTFHLTAQQSNRSLGVSNVVVEQTRVGMIWISGQAGNRPAVTARFTNDRPPWILAHSR